MLDIFEHPLHVIENAGLPNEDQKNRKKFKKKKIRKIQSDEKSEKLNENIPKYREIFVTFLMLVAQNIDFVKVFGLRVVLIFLSDFFPSGIFVIW